MAIPSTESPFQQFCDKDGSPLDSGFVYFGAINQNPETVPVPIYWDAAGTQPAAQPIRTLNGYVTRFGTPALIFTPTVYSVTVRNRKGELVYYVPDSIQYSAKFTNIGQPGSIGRPINAKLSDYPNVHDFGALGDGTTNDAPSIALANTSDALRFVAGRTYRVSSNLTLTNPTIFELGAELLIDPGVTVTFNGAITAPNTQIFSGSGLAVGFARNGEIYPEWWGAIPDGTTDSTTSLQKAITASTGKKLRLSGFYLVTTTLQLTNSISIEGAQDILSGVKTNNLTADVITIACGTGNIQGVELRNFTITATAQKTAGYGVTVTGSTGALYDGVFEHIYMTNMFNGFFCQAALYMRLTDVVLHSVGSNGVGFRLQGVSLTNQVVNVWMSNCIVRSGTAGGNTIGLLIDSYAQGLYIRDCTFESLGLNYGVYINNSAGAALPPENIWLDTVICDNNTTNGFLIAFGLAIRISNCWSTSCLGVGMRIASSTDVSITNHTAIANGQHGIEILAAAKQTRINGGLIDTNSQSVGNTYSGVFVTANTTDFNINNVVFFRSGSTKSQKYDVQIAPGTSDIYIVSNNSLTGGATAGLLDGGTGVRKIVTNNVT